MGGGASREVERQLAVYQQRSDILADGRRQRESNERIARQAAEVKREEMKLHAEIERKRIKSNREVEQERIKSNRKIAQEQIRGQTLVYCKYKSFILW